MSLSKYYRALGIPVGADQATIRKQFRKLAMLYHPDKNPSATAQAKFIIITEAYEILMGKKPAPKTRIMRSGSPAAEPSQSSPERKAKSTAERVREAKDRQQDQQKREQEENERYFRLLTTGWRWRVMRWSAICGVILSLALITERFTQNHFYTEDVVRYNLRAGFSSGHEPISIVETNKSTYWISGLDSYSFSQSPTIYVRSSWIFHEPIELISIAKLRHSPYRVHFTFYTNYWIVVAFFLLPGLTYFTKDQTVRFTIMHQTSFYGVNILMIYFLLRNDHWAHLLTLGFL